MESEFSRVNATISDQRHRWCGGISQNRHFGESGKGGNHWQGFPYEKVLNQADVLSLDVVK